MGWTSGLTLSVMAALASGATVWAFIAHSTERVRKYHRGN